MIKVLFDPTVVLAYLCYIASASLLLVLSVRMMLQVQNQQVGHWFFSAWTLAYLEHIWLPLSRIFALIIFLLIAYPVLFAIPNPPPLSSIIRNWSDVNGLINLMFFTGLLLPLIPMVGNLHAVTVPVQGSVAVAYIFSCLAESQGLENITLMPGFKTLLLMLFFSTLGHSAAKHLAKWLGHILDENLNYQGLTHLLYPSCLLLFQAPVMISYSHSLGRQVLV